MKIEKNVFKIKKDIKASKLGEILLETREEKKYCMLKPLKIYQSEK